MATYTKDSGHRTWLMGTESISILMVHFMRASGRKISSMERVKSSGPMAPPTADYTKMVSNPDMATSFGMTETHTKVSLKITISMDKEPIHGKMVVHSKEIGNTTKCMAMASSRGLTVANTKVNMSMITSRDMESSFGLMDEGTKVAGSSVKWTAKALTHLRKVRSK